MKKWLIAVITALILVVAALAAGAWYFMQQPLYQPGMVRAGRNLGAPLEPPSQTGAVDFWQVEPGIELHHFSAGAGRPVLIVHGGPGYPTTQPWAGLEPLTAQYEFFYYDQRGCGRSSRPVDRFESQDFYQNMQTLDRALGLGAQIADIERIRRLLGEDQLVLVGHSFGGFLAALYAAEFPERVEALILVAPADMLVMPQPSGGLFELMRDRLPADRQAEYDAFLKRYLNFQDIFSRSEAELAALNAEMAGYYAEVMPVEAPQAPQMAQPGGWMVQALYLSMGQRHDYRAALRSVTAPVLILHGADDLQPEAASRAYAETLPNARFVTLAGATHFPFEEQPDAFAAAVDEFLRR